MDSQPLNPVVEKTCSQAGNIPDWTAGASTDSGTSFCAGVDGTGHSFSWLPSNDESDVLLWNSFGGSECGFGEMEAEPGEDLAQGYDNVISVSKGNKICSSYFGDFSPGCLLEEVRAQNRLHSESPCFFLGDKQLRPPVYYLPGKGYFAEVTLLAKSKNKSIYKVVDLESKEVLALGIAKKTEKNKDDLQKEKFYHIKLAASDPSGQFFVLGTPAEIEIEGIQYVLFLMPLMRGGNLAEYLQGNEDPSLHERLEIFSNMLGPVQVLHREGSRHGDLKLENFLIDENPRYPLLSDFGTTNVADPEVMASINDPKIRSPEHVKFKGFQVGQKADIWALGVIAAEMFGASFNKIKALAEAVIDSNEPLIRQRADGIIRKVASKTLLGGKIVESCLRIDPEERTEIEALRMMLFQ